GSGVTITSTAGNVNITASGTTSTKPDASTYSPVDGRAGVSVGLAWEAADVEATANGHITAAGTTGVDTSTSQTFKPSSIDTTTNDITIPNHGFTTGELVVYQPQINAGTSLTPVYVNGTQNQSIGGLTAGSTYAVIVVDQNTIQLA